LPFFISPIIFSEGIGVKVRDKSASLKSPPGKLGKPLWQNIGVCDIIISGNYIVRGSEYKMRMPTFEPSNSGLAESIRQAFVDGNTASTYEQIYVTACKLAVSDAIDFRVMKLEEYFASKNEGDEHAAPHLTDVIKEIQEYAQQKFDYHMDNMMRMIAVYAGQRR
jgi:hypothetical protein